VPPEPVVFNKWTSAICGPDDAVEIPRGSVKTDWEVELGVVIGSSGRYIEEADAWTMWRAIAWSTTCPNASTSSSAAAPGTRARAATPSAPSAPGW
jgi:2-keto-4-pentenoate hydratase/2-oxohepta-3-ene-1,7-dioic acid hydratase in catechol pathway